MIRKRLAGLFVATMLAFAPMVAFAAPASALPKSDITLQCQRQYGAGWTAFIENPNSAFGWRCSIGPFWVVKKDVNLWSWCNYLGYGGAYTNNTSDLYSWYCA